MSREIKFRALKDDHSNCTFQYGQLVYDAIGNPRITEVDSSGQGLTFHTCIKGTEGQYTGLKDRNGKEIYEGDVIRYKIKRLFWGIPEQEIEMEVTIVDGLCNASPQYIEMAEENGAEDVGATVEYIEVIGNIYENPNLINP